MHRRRAGAAPVAGVLIAFTVVFDVGHAVFGMLMGLCFPKLDAVNDTVVVKQSMAVVLGMFVPIGMIAVCMLLYWLGGMVNGALALALPMALLAVFTVVCTAVLAKQGPAMLRAL